MTKTIKIDKDGTPLLTLKGVDEMTEEEKEKKDEEQDAKDIDNWYVNRQKGRQWHLKEDDKEVLRVEDNKVDKIEIKPEWELTEEDKQDKVYMKYREMDKLFIESETDSILRELDMEGDEF